MASVLDNDQENQRAFPRITVSCPVMYLIPTSRRWIVGKLMDFSATGICMVCDTQLAVGTEISLQIKPGSKKTVPELSAIGRVIRCEVNQEQRYVVSCKLIKVNR